MEKLVPRLWLRPQIESLGSYAISVETEELQQALESFPEKKSKSFMVGDPAGYKIASFTLGKGKGGCGPWTVYVVTRSMDICANIIDNLLVYTPISASPSYIHALECLTIPKRP